jgi:hypothetical protein
MTFHDSIIYLESCARKGFIHIEIPITFYLRNVALKHCALRLQQGIDHRISCEQDEAEMKEAWEMGKYGQNGQSIVDYTLI